VGFVVIAALHPLTDVINFCVIMNGLMALPNLLALLALSMTLRRLTHDYRNRMKEQ
jgi:Na+/alanine symporter